MGRVRPARPVRLVDHVRAPPASAFRPRRVASHLGVMVAVAAVMGVRRGRPGDPLRRRARASAPQVAAHTMDRPAGRARRPSRWRSGPDPRPRAATTIATLYDENRINVPLSQISRMMVKAIVAIEDYRFYQHGALDLKGTLRALVTNQASGGVVQGGSSITQQMVKMTLLNQAKTKAERKAATADTYAAQAQRAALRDRLRAELLQGLDPRALPQHRLLRRRRLRHPGGRPALLRHQRQGPQPACRRALLAGLVKNPTGYDPTELPRPRPRSAATSCSTGWPSST